MLDQTLESEELPIVKKLNLSKNIFFDILVNWVYDIGFTTPSTLQWAKKIGLEMLENEESNKGMLVILGQFLSRTNELDGEIGKAIASIAEKNMNQSIIVNPVQLFTIHVAQYIQNTPYKDLDKDKIDELLRSLEDSLEQKRTQK